MLSKITVTIIFETGESILICIMFVTYTVFIKRSLIPPILKMHL